MALFRKTFALLEGNPRNFVLSSLNLSNVYTRRESGHHLSRLPRTRIVRTVRPDSVTGRERRAGLSLRILVFPLSTSRLGTCESQEGIW